MQSFNSFLIEEAFLQEEMSILMEKLITFGGQAYPRFGNIVLMAGGAGSGKGVVLSNLVGLEGKTFDVDELKTLASKAPAIKRRVAADLGVDIENLAQNLKDPKNVEKLHDIMGNYLGVDKRKERAFYRGVLAADPDRKPNIIFDMTLKSLDKLDKIAKAKSSLLQAASLAKRSAAPRSPGPAANAPKMGSTSLMRLLALCAEGTNLPGSKITIQYYEIIEVTQVLSIF